MLRMTHACALLIPWIIVAPVSADEGAGKSRGAEPIAGEERDSLEHLARAAEHLEAAGLREAAARLREDAQHPKQSNIDQRLEEKLQQLQTLRAEVVDLRRMSGRRHQVMFHIEVVELDHAKAQAANVDLENAGLGHSGITISLGREKAPAVQRVRRDDPMFEALRELERQGAIRALARPILVTVSGEPTFLHVGGEFPIRELESGSVAIKYRRHGTSLDLVHEELGGGVIQLHLKVRVAELDKSGPKTLATIPALSVREVDAKVELNADEVAIISGLTRKTIDKSDPSGRSRLTISEVIAIARPEIVRDLEQLTVRPTR